MADNVTASGNTISTEEVTTLNGVAVPAQQVQRVIPSIRTADGIVVDGNSSSAALVSTGTLQSAAAAVGNGTAFDVSGYATTVFNVTGTFSGTITFEASSDDTNWSSLNATAIGLGTIGTTASTTGQYRASVAGLKTVRARVSSYTSGSITVTGRATVADSAPKFMTVDPYRLDPVNDGVTSYPFGHSYTNITTNATTTVKSGSGFLHSIKINNPSAITVANLTITIYDNTAASGTLLGTITVPFGITGAMPFDIDFEAAFTTGLTIVTAGPTVTGNLTIEWR